VPDELVERFAIAGTPKEARDQLERLANSGLVDEIAVIPHTHDPRERDQVIRLVGEFIPASSGAAQAAR
jgi:alkanesulfonate monooxygenase SsuD/methylene tetrahydromethanopterin reductase-like flavin-dependent oxidoreductase (luciferase family)